MLWCCDVEYIAEQPLTVVASTIFSGAPNTKATLFGDANVDKSPLILSDKQKLCQQHYLLSDVRIYLKWQKVRQSGPLCSIYSSIIWCHRSFTKFLPVWILCRHFLFLSCKKTNFDETAMFTALYLILSQFQILFNNAQPNLCLFCIFRESEKMKRRNQIF